MEDEIAAILLTVVRSISAEQSAHSALNRIHVLRNVIVFRMDWRNVHCPIAVSNHILTLLCRENVRECRCRMAVVCDLVFSSLIGHDSFFTHFVALGMEEAPRGPC